VCRFARPPTRLESSTPRALCGSRSRPCGTIKRPRRHLTGTATRRAHRLVVIGLLAAVLTAPSLLLDARAAIVVEPLLAAVIVGLLVAFWRGERKPEPNREEAEFLALHDALTGLPNRTLFDDRLEHALAQAKRDGEGAAVMVVDVDRFKQINDMHGHSAGDTVLRAVAERLACTLRNSDTIARLGGDEFGVVLGGIDIGGALDSAARMEDALTAPVDVDGSPVDANASIGIAVHPQHGSDAETLVHRADVAMYDAKRTGIGYAIFDAATASTAAARRRLASELRGAVARRELLLHYQPRLDLRSGEIAAVEALARWQHPTLGLLAADTFMTLAEESGLGRAICDQVIGDVAAQCAAWRRTGFAFDVAVNVDARSLADDGFPERLRRLLEVHDVEPETIELELSERALLSALTGSRHVVFALADVGVQLVVDDFGTGYSSLGYLAHVPISKLKIDRSLLLRAEASPRERIVAAATVALAHELGLQVVAEGVEDENGLAFVRELGADYAQGYLLGAPTPASSLRPLVALA
jgi:diguanylate cyclase (GGDEF)-like protein